MKLGEEFRPGRVQADCKAPVVIRNPMPLYVRLVIVIVHDQSRRHAAWRENEDVMIGLVGDGLLVAGL